MPDKKKTLLIDTDGIVKALSNNQFLNIPDNGRNFDKPVPYMPAERLQDGSLAGIYMMNDGIRDGWKTLYDRDSYSNDIYRDESGNYYRIKNGLEEEINMDGLTRLSYDELRKVLPKRDYIGGNKEEAAIKALSRIPGFTDYIWSRANAYGVDPNVIINRIAKEGYARDIAVEYNELDSAGQNDEFWKRLWDRKVDGFSQFGLDDVASHINAGYYTLLDPEASWSEGYNVNEKGREVLSANPDNLKSAVEILTAEMKYRQDKMKDRYSLSDNELGTYANAAYNLGLYSKDLDDKNYVIRKYSYPDYYKTYGLSYKNGGNIKTRKEKLSELAEKIKSSGYKFSNGGSLIDRFGADSVRQALRRMREVNTVKENTYKDGGGKLGNLLRRMSNAAIMNDPNTGVVAQASGYNIDPSGNMKQNPEYEGARQLSRNIAVLSVVPNALMSSQVVAPVMTVLANPLAADTTAGALIATAADAYGVVEGARQLGLDAEKAISGEYRIADIPKTLMDAGVLIPGTNAINVPVMAKNLITSGNIIRNIPKITSESTVLNRVFHPVETYRFSDLTTRSKKVIPAEMYDELLEDLKKTRFFNKPYGIKGYNLFNRKPANYQLGVFSGRDRYGNWVEPMIFGLGDRTATNDFSRAHEIGHLVDDAAVKTGYVSDNFPPSGYRYGFDSIMTDPDRVISEFNADVFGNSITSDMSHDYVENIRKLRYPYVRNYSVSYVKGNKTPK